MLTTGQLGATTNPSLIWYHDVISTTSELQEALYFALHTNTSVAGATSHHPDLTLGWLQIWGFDALDEVLDILG